MTAIRNLSPSNAKDTICSSILLRRQTFKIQIQNNFISYNTEAYEIYYETETLLGLL